MIAPAWFRPRGYKHFDVPVGASFALAVSPEFVAEHSWCPLIHYLKVDKRYKALQGKTVKKLRPIMYASHRDACILSLYSQRICRSLDEWYQENGLDDVVIAYRATGKANYHFALQAQSFILAHNSVTVMCFDVTGFFDHLDHVQLKERLRWLIGCPELPDDWYKVYRNLTKYRFIEKSDLEGSQTFAARMKSRARVPIATMAELKAAGITIHKNPNAYGIPQGTPISASLSNLYMTEVDRELHAITIAHGGLYQRYSDDILVACPPSQANVLEKAVEDLLTTHGLQLQKAKTERKTLNGTGVLTVQYLGFQLGQCEARIRPGSISRQWRAARRAIRKAEHAGLRAVGIGAGKTTYTKKLHRRFNDARARNFISYANRSADVLKSKSIKKQTKKLRKFVTKHMRRLKGRDKPGMP